MLNALSKVEIVKKSQAKRKQIIGDDKFKELHAKSQQASRLKKRNEIGDAEYKKQQSIYMKELRAKKKLLSEKVSPDITDLTNTFNSFNLANSIADTMLNDVFQNVINTVPAKYGRGRPPLHFEERHKREIEKELKPKRPVGRPRKNTL